jgi:hypothetical protein
LLPSAVYNCTLRQIEDGYCWTVNEGEFAWRNIIDDYTPPERICEALKTNSLDIGQQALTRVTVKLDGNWKKNVIIEYIIPDRPPEFNVLKPKTDDHFFHSENKRKLPI